MGRRRLRDLGIPVGVLPPGPENAITDVDGVWVGHATVIRDAPRIARTGVTVILPRAGDVWNDHCCAGYHAFNGNGEMTGIHWIREAGMLTTPIAITNTHQVGVVRDELVEYECRHHPDVRWLLPVVAETHDGWLNDINGFHLTRQHVLEALATAGPGPVAEGNVGGGTGMICHEFKGGIGTASRLAATGSGTYTVGALVQANYGDRADLRVDGFPAGRYLGPDVTPLPWTEVAPGGSIIVIVATDAPLLPIQCRRLAQRATVGLSRVGGVGHNGSGDIFLAFATGNHLPARSERPVALQMLPNAQMDELFAATAEAVEEAILNALTAAETMTGFRGRTVHALPLEALQKVMAGFRR
jgi:D-aminopeptidase